MRDRDRPPVLAHQRFVAQRHRLQTMTVAERFAAIHAGNMWGAESSVSGLGSELDATVTLVSELPPLLHELHVTSLLDAPCGDAGWMAGLDLGGIRYTGIDIVAALVAENTKRHCTLGTFLVGDIIRDPLPRADAILCRDCFVHLGFANIIAAVANFRRSGARWLIATTFPMLARNSDCADGDWRALNLEKAPFAWSTPVALLNERCEEAGGGWRDKSLGVWDLCHLKADCAATANA